MIRQLMSVTAVPLCWNVRRCCCHTSRIDKRGSYCIIMTWFELHCALVDFHQDLDLRELLLTTELEGIWTKWPFFFFLQSVFFIIIIYVLRFRKGAYSALFIPRKVTILQSDIWEQQEKKKNTAGNIHQRIRYKMPNASLNMEDVQHHKIQQWLRKQKPQWRLLSQTSDTVK